MTEWKRFTDMYPDKFRCLWLFSREFDQWEGVAIGYIDEEDEIRDILGLPFKYIFSHWDYVKRVKPPEVKERQQIN